MNYILATFRSRNETFVFARLLKNNGVQAGVINTPSQIAGQNCSISVKIQQNALAIAQRLMCEARFQTFNGFYIMYYSNGKLIIDKVT